jgi:hypothetical protein
MISIVVKCLKYKETVLAMPKRCQATVVRMYENINGFGIRHVCPVAAK